MLRTGRRVSVHGHCQLTSQGKLLGTPSLLQPELHINIEFQRHLWCVQEELPTKRKKITKRKHLRILCLIRLTNYNKQATEERSLDYQTTDIFDFVAHLITTEQWNAILARVVNKRAWVWLSLTIPGSSSMFWHSVGQTKARSLGLSSGRGDEEVVMTMETWESNDVSLPPLWLFSSLQGKGRMGLSGSVWCPGRRLERTSSDTGIKAEIRKQFIRNTINTVAQCLTLNHPTSYQRGWISLQNNTQDTSSLPTTLSLPAK